MDAKDVNSIEAEITGDAFDFNPVVGDANAENLSYSKYGDMHRFVGVASQSWNYGSNNQWGTTVTTFFEFNRGGRYSYTYAGDINGDGRSGNDLLYVPTVSEIYKMNFSDPSHAKSYNKFIEQDEYLRSRRGKMRNVMVHSALGETVLMFVCYKITVYKQRLEKLMLFS